MSLWVHYIILGFIKLFECLYLTLFNLRSLGPLFLQIISLPSVLSWIPTKFVLVFLMLLPRFFRFCLDFLFRFSSFSFYSLDMIISVILSSSSLILSSTWSAIKSLVTVSFSPPHILNYLFTQLFWLCWISVAVWAFPLVAKNRGHSSVVHGLLCSGLSLPSTGSRAHKLQQLWLLAPEHRPIVAAHRLSCFSVCGIFSDKGSNPCLLHWQADSLRQPPGEAPPVLFNLL